jgi:hypothetical protein
MISTNDQKRRTDDFADRKIEPNKKKRKLSTNDFYHDPLNCTDIKSIPVNGVLEEQTNNYYPKIELTYSDGMKIRFRERRDKKQNLGSLALVVHYESEDFPATIHFSIKFSSNPQEYAMISRINRMKVDKPCGQIKGKVMRHVNDRISEPLFLFLSKTYEGTLHEFMDEKNRLDKKKVQHIILQVRDQLICLRKKYNMCYMDIKPENILYLYPDGHDDKKNIEVVLGDLGSEGISTYNCVSSETNTTYQEGACKGTELLSDCQKYNLSLTYLILCDGYERWLRIAMDPNANRDTVRDVQNALRSDVVTGGETMYEILWETKEDKEVTKSLKMIEIWEKILDAYVRAEIEAIFGIKERKYTDSEKREADKKTAREHYRIVFRNKVLSEEGIDQTVFLKELRNYRRENASFNALIDDMEVTCKEEIEAIRYKLEDRINSQ